MFGRELQTPDDVHRDLCAIIQNDNFVPEITPYLKRLSNHMKQIRDNIEMKEDKCKFYADQKVSQTPQLRVGDKFWVNLYPRSKSNYEKTAKFMPRRDGLYVIQGVNSSTAYLIATQNYPFTPIGKYHCSCLQPYRGDSEGVPVAPNRRRGRPAQPDAKKNKETVPIQRFARFQPATRGRQLLVEEKTVTSVLGLTYSRPGGYRIIFV